MSRGLHLEAFTDLLAGAQQARQVVEIALDELVPSPIQVRAPFDPHSNEEDAGLVESVKQDGIIQPLLVTLGAEGGKYQVIAGHRRLAAAGWAGLTTVPCIVLTVDSVQAAIRTGLDNLQRRDLSPLEEGWQYVMLMRLSGLSARELARRLGKPERTVQQRVALTGLPPRVQELLEQGVISVHQALGCQHAAWGGSLAELAAQHGLPRAVIDQAVSYLEAHPGATPADAVQELVRAAGGTGDGATGGGAARGRKRARPATRGGVDYGRVVEGLDGDLPPEQRALLAEYAGLEGLEPHAVRWAALVLAGSRAMTVAAAVAYAGQLARAPLGRALRAIDEGVAALEGQARVRRQLTPNLVTAARAVLMDVAGRLARVGENLERAAGLACAGAVGGPARDDSNRARGKE